MRLKPGAGSRWTLRSSNGPHSHNTSIRLRRKSSLGTWKLMPCWAHAQQLPSNLSSLALVKLRTSIGPSKRYRSMWLEQPWIHNCHGRLRRRILIGRQMKSIGSPSYLWFEPTIQATMKSNQSGRRSCSRTIKDHPGSRQTLSWIKERTILDSVPSRLRRKQDRWSSFPRSKP